MTLFHFDCPRAFSASECDRIIGLAAPFAMEPGPVWGGAGYGVDERMRKVAISFHGREGTAGWIVDRLDLLFGQAAEAFALAVEPLSEPVQIARYDVGCHFQTWHSDAGTDRHAARIVSASVELTEESDYDGGLLEIVPSAMGGGRALPRGGARFFPSRALHHVTPVTRGVRYALVAWAGAH